MQPKIFQQRILNWFDQHGRKNLPWQFDKTPYRVWVSEIMLQQTQVKTVIPYFIRFMDRFPRVTDLAAAPLDDVLHLWAGLGYYSRARNLHRSAQYIVTEHGSDFPATVAEVEKLPGIGRSTAGAILAISRNQPTPILDGNVKRVLTRFAGIAEPLTDKRVIEKLWGLATRYTPKTRAADYTQAMMDIGATLCTRSKPGCTQCPLASHCVALAEDLTTMLPVKKAARALPTKAATVVILRHQQSIVITKRPAEGIWGGLWSLPEIKDEPDTKRLRYFCSRHWEIKNIKPKPLAAFKHTFSHYHLMIHPILIDLSQKPRLDIASQTWYNLAKPPALGLPKPIQSLLRKIS